MNRSINLCQVVNSSAAVDKVHECLLNRCLCTVGSGLHRVAGVHYYLSTEVNGRTVRISRIVRYIVDVCYEVCPQGFTVLGLETRHLCINHEELT